MYSTPPKSDSAAAIPPKESSASDAAGINERIASAVAAAMKPMAQQLNALVVSQSKASATDSIDKAVAEAIAAKDAEHAKTAERQKFISEHLKGIPDAFHSHIGDDPEKFLDDAKALREALHSVGFMAPNVGGHAVPGSVGTVAGVNSSRSVMALLDLNNASASENIRAGLSQSRSDRPMALPVSEAMKTE